MSEIGNQTRLAQLEAQAQERVQQQAAPPFPKARNRREQLSIALAHLERGGVTGSYAYAPLFHACARVGIILKPLHYRSWIGLICFFMVLAMFIAVFVLVAVGLTGTMPRPVRGMMNAGPLVFFSGTFVFSVAFAAIHKIKAAQIGLPRWRDL